MGRVRSALRPRPLAGAALYSPDPPAPPLSASASHVLVGVVSGREIAVIVLGTRTFFRELPAIQWHQAGENNNDRQTLGVDTVA